MGNVRYMSIDTTVISFFRHLASSMLRQVSIYIPGPVLPQILSESLNFAAFLSHLQSLIYLFNF